MYVTHTDYQPKDEEIECPSCALMHKDVVVAYENPTKSKEIS